MNFKQKWFPFKESGWNLYLISFLKKSRRVEFAWTFFEESKPNKASRVWGVGKGLHTLKKRGVDLFVGWTFYRAECGGSSNPPKSPLCFLLFLVSQGDIQNPKAQLSFSVGGFFSNSEGAPVNFDSNTVFNRSQRVYYPLKIDARWWFQPTHLKNII